MICPTMCGGGDDDGAEGEGSLVGGRFGIGEWICGKWVLLVRWVTKEGNVVTATECRE